MNPEGVDSETISIIDRALEQFRAGQVEVRSN
jgi:hypothetical protein